MAWRWVQDHALLALHDEQIAEHGGLSGVRDQGLLASALARPQNQAVYNDAASVFDLATSYAFGIIRNHPFLDGNKRTGFMAAAIFLELNGWELQAPEVAAVTIVLGLAEGSIDEKEFSSWLQENVAKL